MPFILIHCVDHKIQDVIRKWIKGIRGLDKYFMEKIDTRSYLLEANGEILSLLWSLKKRNNDKLDIFIVEPLYESDIPNEIKEVVKCLEDHPKTTKIFEKVRNLKMKCTVNLKIE